MQQQYSELCQLMQVEEVNSDIDLWQFSSPEKISMTDQSTRTTAALNVFLDQLVQTDIEPTCLNKDVLEGLIARVDEQMQCYLHQVLHDSEFQSLESLWRSLQFILDRSDLRSNVKIDILSMDKNELKDDFDASTEIMKSGLYHQVYTQEYDTPGGEPYSAMITNFEFTTSQPDLDLLKSISSVASASHCPCIGSVGGDFFHKEDFQEVFAVEDLKAYMQRAEYIAWNSFRETEDSRYIGLTMPKFLLRMPYGHQNPIKTFAYSEEDGISNHEHMLWGNASFALASNITRSFKQYGWSVNIRGPESGGKVEGLPLPQFNMGMECLIKPPTEIMIPETREIELADLGFIPMSYYKHSDFGCFFSANSSQMPSIYSTAIATANSRINARLPYIFLSSRIAHYLKVLQRENIGAAKNHLELQAELNIWLQGLITKMNNPGPEIAASHPLKEGHVEVIPIDDNPGFYRLNLNIVPHFQIEGIDVKLSLVSQMPRDTTK